MHPDLGAWLRQAGLDEYQSGPGLLRGLGAAIHQLDHFTKLNKPSDTAMPGDQWVDVLAGHAGLVCQRVHPDDGAQETLTTAQIEGGPCGCRRGDAGDVADFRCVEFVSVDDDAASASIHRVPNSAEADTPPTTALRSDHSQAAFARTPAVTGEPGGKNTLR